MSRLALVPLFLMLSACASFRPLPAPPVAGEEPELSTLSVIGPRGQLDRAARERIEARNGLENHVFGVKSQVEDSEAGLGGKITQGERETVSLSFWLLEPCLGRCVMVLCSLTGVADRFWTPSRR